MSTNWMENCPLIMPLPVKQAEGFIPCNLAWATVATQNTEQMFKIIANQEHEIKCLRAQLQAVRRVA